jgi:hypothetical protein
MFIQNVIFSSLATLCAKYIFNFKNFEQTELSFEMKPLKLLPGTWYTSGLENRRMNGQIC